jgi:hypothetical protein
MEETEEIEEIEEAVEGGAALGAKPKEDSQSPQCQCRQWKTIESMHN